MRQRVAALDRVYGATRDEARERAGPVADVVARSRAGRSAHAASRLAIAAWSGRPTRRPRAQRRRSSPPAMQLAPSSTRASSRHWSNATGCERRIFARSNDWIGAFASRQWTIGSVTSRDDRERRLVEQVVRLGDRAVQRVLDRQHAERDLGRDRASTTAMKLGSGSCSTSGREQQRRRRAVRARPAPDSRRVRSSRPPAVQASERHGVADAPNSARRRGAAQVERAATARRAAASTAAPTTRAARARARRGRARAAARASAASRPGWPRPCRRCRAPSRAPARRSPGPSSPRLADAARPRPPVTAGGDVGEDVAEGVLGHEHVEVARVHDDAHRDAVDEAVRELDVGVVRADLGRRRCATGGAVSSTFALSTESRRPPRVRASSNARRAMRATSVGWYSHVSKTVPSSRTPRAPK